MPYTDDALILPLVENLHACLCSTLEERGLEAECLCLMAPGEVVPPSIPAPGKGTAWITVDRIFPATSFGVQTEPSSVNCATGLNVDLSMGVVRCMPISRENPSPEEYAEFTRQMLADMQAVRQAILCCDHGIEDIALLEWTPYGPSGGVYGGYWTLQAG